MTTSTSLPHQYQKRILLVVIGMTPQIVTETLYKLAIDSETPFIPTEIHIITTKEGANSVKVALLGTENDEGKFYTLCNDYNLSGIRFNEDMIHIIADTEGQFINDSESDEQNKIASDFITQKVQQFTKDSDTALHVSLAGGRKTMSYYAGYALSLYGRWQDRLSHIIVNQPFMSTTEFFYPRPKAERFEINNRYYSTDDARIILSDIEYLRMRYQVPEALLEGKAGFQETIRKIQRFNDEPSVTLNFSQLTVAFNGLTLQLPMIDFAFYAWMCERKQQQQPPLILDEDAFMFDFLEIYAFITRGRGHYPRTAAIAKEKGVTEQKNWFETRKSALHKAIKIGLGNNLALPFFIQGHIHQQKMAYTIDIPAERIEIIK